MNDTATLRLAFHLEAAGTVPESLERAVKRIEGIETAQTRLLQPARGIDPVPAATILLTVTATTKTGAVASRNILEMIRNVKAIAAESGITKIFLEHDRKKKDISHATSDQLTRLAEETELSNPADGD